MVKPRLYGEDEISKKVAENVLLHVLENILKLLHPFMPFITEEIWRHLPPHREEALIISSWPVYDEKLYYPQSEKNMAFVMSGIRSIRNARQEMNIPSSKKAKILICNRRRKCN